MLSVNQDHAKELAEKTVIYINLDSAVKGDLPIIS